MSKSTSQQLKVPTQKKLAYQLCPMCGEKIGVLSGSFDAICKNCGYKDPCCE